jgi:hypothetical protein
MMVIGRRERQWPEADIFTSLMLRAADTTQLRRYGVNASLTDR